MSTVVSFTADQVMCLLEYLEAQADAGYEIQDVIEGIKDGSLVGSASNGGSYSGLPE